jgi:adenosine deaminase
MGRFPAEFISAIPKTDLHVHLDGSIRLTTLIELAEERGIELPANTPEGLRNTVFKPAYTDLTEYLSGFALTGKVLQDAAALERVAYELAVDNAEENVKYLEVRFAPQLHMSQNLSFEEVMRAVDQGLRTARTAINARLSEDEPAFEYGIIVCAMRYFDANFSEYYKDLAGVHSYSDMNEVIQLASIELAKATVRLRHNSDVQVVAFDLAGAEHGYPASAHQEAYDHVHRHFLKKTVHAGEAYGPESIFQAITKLHADRIGHGLRLFNTDMIYSDDIEDRDYYVQNLINFIADRRITIEVCLTSNLQTAPDIARIEDHSVGKMLANNLSVSFCTDNRLVSHTTVTDEITKCLGAFDVSPKQLKNIMIYGFKRSFFYRPYTEKRRYVRQVINWYESLERKFAVKN